MLAPEQKTVEAQTVITMTHTGSHADIGAVYRELHAWAMSHNVSVLGPGLTIFHCAPNEFVAESAVFEVCLPVPSGTEGDTRVTVKSLPSHTVAAIRVTGPYRQIPAHYTEMLAWLTADGLEPSGAPREVYIKRPAADGTGDPNAFVTEIQFPIE